MKDLNEVWKLGSAVWPNAKDVVEVAEVESWLEHFVRAFRSWCLVSN